MEQTNKDNNDHKIFKIRYDKDNPLHPATLILYYMLTELLSIEIECLPIYNCKKSIDEFLNEVLPKNSKRPDIELPMMAYTNDKGVKKVRCSEAWILQTLVRKTSLALPVLERDYKWLSFAGEIKTLMTKLSEDVFEEIVDGQFKEIIVVDESHQVELDKILDTLEKQLLLKGTEFLIGNTLTLADLAVISELFPTFPKLEASARNLRESYVNVICWLKRLDGIYAITYVLRQRVDLYPGEKFHPVKLATPLEPVKLS